MIETATFIENSASSSRAISGNTNIIATMTISSVVYRFRVSMVVRKRRARVRLSGIWRPITDSIGCCSALIERNPIECDLANHEKSRETARLNSRRICYHAVAYAHPNCSESCSVDFGDCRYSPVGSCRLGNLSPDAANREEPQVRRICAAAKGARRRHAHRDGL